jgi:hypothetical protein
VAVPNTPKATSWVQFPAAPTKGKSLGAKCFVTCIRKIAASRDRALLELLREIRGGRELAEALPRYIALGFNPHRQALIDLGGRDL